ncbi:DnaJ-related protein SCJ1 [Hanseniaspora osmophila]|uniref:DnaJ-related protein SCJ1 n=1 Tax=Hanseniaspora osmophila TaxID=56408 RepID=A0A1E5R829_9ASCO|nr:DnaJ-related protein SCJ1 [Hanseniaspora osmophila]
MKFSLYSLFVLNFFWLISSVFAQDYYKILGIERTASEKEIKSAYRQLSKKFHPDKNPDNEEAHHKFIEIGEAYEVLSDSEKKTIFDRHGAEAVKQAQQAGQQGGHQPFQDPMDMFHQFFGGGGGANGGGFQHRTPKTPTIQFQTPISLRQYYLGDTLTFELPLRTACRQCNGQGGKLETCGRCQGHGILIRQFRQGPMIQKIQQQCDLCNGQGKTLKEKCGKCHGQTVVQENKETTVDLPKGAIREYKAVLEGQGELYPGHEQGDIVVQFSESERDNMGYRRRGNNLYRTEYLSLKEALLGNWERELEFFDPTMNKIKLKRQSGERVIEGEIEVKSGFGMPFDDGNEEGDLFIDYHIIMPIGMDSAKASQKYFDEL